MHEGNALKCFPSARQHACCPLLQEKTEGFSLMFTAK